MARREAAIDDSLWVMGARVAAWFGFVCAVLLLLECASITFTNDESGGLIRIDLLLVFPIGAVAAVAALWSLVAVVKRRRGGLKSFLISLATMGVLATCLYGSHQIFVVTAHIADAVGFRPKDCIGDSTPGFDWARYCPVE